MALLSAFCAVHDFIEVTTREARDEGIEHCWQVATLFMTMKKWLSSRASWRASSSNYKESSTQQERHLVNEVSNQDEDAAEHERYPAHHDIASYNALPLRHVSLPSPTTNHNKENQQQQQEQLQNRQQRARMMMSREEAFFPTDISQRQQRQSDNDAHNDHSSSSSSLIDTIRQDKKLQSLVETQQNTEIDEKSDRVRVNDTSENSNDKNCTTIDEAAPAAVITATTADNEEDVVKKKAVHFDPESIRFKEEIFPTRQLEKSGDNENAKNDNDEHGYNSDEDDLEGFIGLEFDSTSDRMAQRYGSMRFPP